ncbi:asparaginase [Rubellimicrobium sp. CFH 75288]|uniref:asparaginase n=1 Tax=Rubellimicrobium sp. CFH 75288 TaxID=2697034 RepID=UPI0014121B1A|nr:asparaginase [Rubellimicrobium sp. CFH 75288]NAZ37540.1 asparaginase [Rubellimicrobium sp. CFH 75288]
MTQGPIAVEIWRGGVLESRHRVRAVVCGPDGEPVAAWGDDHGTILPRSACKMVQALPLLTSGAGEGLGDERLALACASHGGAVAHVERVEAWLADLGLGDDDLRCGAHRPMDRQAADALIREGRAPRQVHNNCSGKHAGFLHLARHLRAGGDYLDPEGPVQRAVRDAFEEAIGAPSPGWAIDGCSAPNFACTLQGLARAAAGFAAPEGQEIAPRAAEARRRLVAAMMAHPHLVAGEGRACTDLMRAAPGRVAAKTGAEGVYLAILPERGLGLALKAEDGATRAAEAAVAALLEHLGAVERGHPAVARLARGEIRNWRGTVTGHVATLL